MKTLRTAAAAFALVGVAALAPATASADVVHFGADGTGDGTRAFYQAGLTVAPSGDVYALQPDPYNRVLHFTSALAFAGSWGEGGGGAGEFSLPHGVAVTTAGDVLV